MVILALNVGSSSVKWAAGDQRGEDDGWQRTKPDAVGHRVVHGGERRAPVVIDPSILQELEALVPLAPLHQPPALKLIGDAMRRFPSVPHVACFDTAFHATLPEVAYRYALPYDVRRYGFHGLSYESIVARVPMKRGVIAHLGSGASVCAIRDGRSIDTTMGMSPTGGVIMGTRPGDLDPGVVVYLAKKHGLDAVDHALEHDSGLKALAGTSDMRKIDDDRAIDAFCYSVKKAIGGYIAVLGGIDTLVFTGGIGAHDARVRERISAGLPVDDIRVLETDEEGTIARHVRDTLGHGDQEAARPARGSEG